MLRVDPTNLDPAAVVRYARRVFHPFLIANWVWHVLMRLVIFTYWVCLDDFVWPRPSQFVDGRPLHTSEVISLRWRLAEELSQMGTVILIVSIGLFLLTITELIIRFAGGKKSARRVFGFLVTMMFAHLVFIHALMIGVYCRTSDPSFIHEMFPPWIAPRIF